MIIKPAPVELFQSAITLPEFNIFAVQLGGVGVRWYALAYIAGLLIGIYILRRVSQLPGALMTPNQTDRLLNYLLIGIILGGRLGYVFFYNAGFYLANPVSIFRLWEGGMSFHGALLGVGCALFLMARRHELPFLAITDRVAMVSPLGLFLGRVSNFINGELYGRITNVPWAMIFPHSDGQPRHPSQLYEAGLEGLLLGLLMYLFWRLGWLGALGRLTAVFLCSYGVARFFIEFVRQPDAHIGLFGGILSMGQLLSFPMIIIGLYLLHQSWRQGYHHDKS